MYPQQLTLSRFTKQRKWPQLVFLFAVLSASARHGQASPKTPQSGSSQTIAAKDASARLVHSVPPVYPDDARQARLEGTVVLNIIIGADGSVKSLKVISGPPSLVPAAALAVRQWQYKPYILNGKPVEVDTKVIVSFALGQSVPDILPCAKQAAPDAGPNGTPPNNTQNTNSLQQTKSYFTAAMSSLEQAKQIASKLKRTNDPKEQESLRTTFGAACGDAVEAFGKADQATSPDQRTNHSTILANLASVYAVAGRHDDAAAAFGRAIEWEPSAALYSNMSTELAEQGSTAEAKAACEKAGNLSGQELARCWANIGIVLYNSSKFKEAVGVLEQATASNPQDSVGWYLLADSLRHASSDAIHEGAERSRIVGAYQKCLQLAPNGTYAERAKSALQEMHAPAGNP